MTSRDDCITSAEWLAEVRALLATDGLSDQLRQDTLRLWYNRLLLLTVVPDTPAADTDRVEVVPGPTRQFTPEGKYTALAFKPFDLQELLRLARDYLLPECSSQEVQQPPRTRNGAATVSVVYNRTAPAMYSHAG